MLFISRLLYFLIVCIRKKTFRGQMSLVHGSVRREDERRVLKPHAFRLCCSTTQTAKDDEEEELTLAAPDLDLYEKWMTVLVDKMGCTLLQPIEDIPQPELDPPVLSTQDLGRETMNRVPAAPSSSSGYAMDDIDDDDDGNVVPPPVSPKAYTMNDIDTDDEDVTLHVADEAKACHESVFADIDEDNDDYAIPPVTDFQNIDIEEEEVDVTEGPTYGDGSDDRVEEPEADEPICHSSPPQLTAPSDSYDFGRLVARRRSLSPKSSTPPPPSDIISRNRTTSESLPGSEPQHFKHSSHMSEEDLRSVPLDDKLLSPKVLSGERPRLTLRINPRNIVGSNPAITPRGIVVPQPSMPVSDGESPELVALDELQIRISITELSHPAKLLRKRVRLRRLFQTEDHVVPFDEVKGVLCRLQDDAHETSTSFPYLSLNGCQWADVMRYLAYEERFKRARGDASVEASFRLDILSSGQSFYFFCELTSWADTCVKQVALDPW